MLAGALLVFCALITVVVWFVPLLTRRYRLFGYIFVANLAASLVLVGVEWWLDRAESRVVVNEIAERAGISTHEVLSSGSVAQLAAMFAVVGPFVSRRWRRAGLVAISVVVFLRIVVAVHLPANVLVALRLGAALGAGVLYAFGRPDRRPTPAAIEAALRDTGLPLAEIRRAEVDARGSTPYIATLEDGSRLFV